MATEKIPSAPGSERQVLFFALVVYGGAKPNPVRIVWRWIRRQLYILDCKHGKSDEEHLLFVAEAVDLLGDEVRVLADLR